MENVWRPPVNAEFLARSALCFVMMKKIMNLAITNYHDWTSCNTWVVYSLSYLLFYGAIFLDEVLMLTIKFDNICIKILSSQYFFDILSLLLILHHLKNTAGVHILNWWHIFTNWISPNLTLRNALLLNVSHLEFLIITSCAPFQWV